MLGVPFSTAPVLNTVVSFFVLQSREDKSCYCLFFNYVNCPKKKRHPDGADDVYSYNVSPSCSFYAACQNGYARVALSLKTVHRTVFAA